MKMTKIDALKATLVKLNNPNVKYNWGSMYTCNSGLMMQCIFNKKPEDLMLLVDSEQNFGNMWGGLNSLWGIEEYCHDTKICSVSGFPIHTIFETLKSMGFTRGEIIDLEYLSNPNICEKLGWPIVSSPRDSGAIKSKRKNVIAYISVWIEILENETLKEEVKEETIKYVVVEIDSQILQEAKELINNEAILN